MTAVHVSFTVVVLDDVQVAVVPVGADGAAWACASPELPAFNPIAQTVAHVGCIPTDNAVVHGFVDGAQAASDSVDKWKHRRLEPPAAPPPSALQSSKGRRKPAR